MAKTRASLAKDSAGVTKVPTGIRGLDEITGGGLPEGRTTLVCGGPGTGKTLLGAEFVVRGARDMGAPGVFMSFEETVEELKQNVASLGFGLDALERDGLVSLDNVRTERADIEETGEYDLEGLFVRLGYAIDSVNAKRVVLDSLKMLFSALSNQSILRAEIRRLFRWLSDRGVTALVTAERGEGRLTRYGLEEYVSDCVLSLDNRVERQLATRRLRIVKYRGSAHGTDEYPFILTKSGYSVLPITSLELRHTASTRLLSSGVERLDALLGGGYYEGSSILVSGTAGTGKTTLGALLADAACGRNERVLFLAFEESPAQLVRNMRSISLDLQRWVDKGMLRLQSRRPTTYGLESHLADMHEVVETFDPKVVVVDAISAFRGDPDEVTAMLARLVDHLKSRGTSSLFTTLTHRDEDVGAAGLGISSAIDAWISLRSVESNGERNRLLEVIKSRGMAHSNQVREFFLSDSGLDLRDVYTGLKGVALGSARLAAEAHERNDQARREAELDRRRRAVEAKRAALEAQIAAMRADLDYQISELDSAGGEEEARSGRELNSRALIAAERRADTAPAQGRLPDDDGSS
jgi:circadian clock protein KaiC